MDEHVKFFYSPIPEKAGGGWLVTIQGRPEFLAEGSNCSIESLLNVCHTLQYGGEFHRVSLWRGRRWPRSQEHGETSLGEAGSKQQI